MVELGASAARLTRWVGLWPAASGLLAFVWPELVSTDSNYLWIIRLWFSAYVAILVIGAAVFGDRWIAAADPFEAYSTLVGHLSVFGRRGDGVLVVRNPLSTGRREGRAPAAVRHGRLHGRRSVPAAHRLSDLQLTV